MIGSHLIGSGVLPQNGRLIYRLYQIVWYALDWIYPPQCGGCEKSYVRWCQVCQESTLWLDDQVCERCGAPMSSNEPCIHCASRDLSYQAQRSCAVYNGPLRHAIHRLKYGGDLALGETLARPLIDLLERLRWQVDLITPVPGSLVRRRERGYNQASLLALPVALGSGIPYRPQALWKVRDTPSQVGLDLQARRQNVKHAFQARRQQVQGKTVLVIDDITTSGATLEACAEILISQGARQVFGLTLARAVL